MLVARRDPPFHSGAHETMPASGRHLGLAAHQTRFITALQIIGSLLAIPVGLASAYSIYHSNFSAEAQCQSLRGNIIAMLDKSADASTLRMLVRRDVEMFETSCGAVDPDAVAAFKMLLARKTTAPTGVAPPPQPAAREPVHVGQPVKPAAPKAAPVVEAKPIRRDAAPSDANWIASVREALLHAPETHEKAGESPAAAAAPAVQPAAPQLRALRETPAPAVSLAPPAPAAAPALRPGAAPALPPAATVAAAPEPASDHPVPPGSIPDSVPLPSAAPAETPAHAGGWLSRIPILNRVVGQ
jgi:hypothetical protein